LERFKIVYMHRCSMHGLGGLQNKFLMANQI
jgi:hypothetical protein